MSFGELNDPGVIKVHLEGNVIPLGVWLYGFCLSSVCWRLFLFTASLSTQLNFIYIAPFTQTCSPKTNERQKKCSVQSCSELSVPCFCLFAVFLTALASFLSCCFYICWRQIFCLSLFSYPKIAENILP